MKNTRFDKSKLPSRHVTEGPARAAHRSYLYAMGITEEEIHQPLVGVATCWNEAAPCNIALNRQALGQSFFGTQAAAPIRALSPANIAGYQPPQPEWSALPFVARQEQARRLLMEAEADTLAQRLSLTVAVTDSPADTRLLEPVAADFAAIDHTADPGNW